MWSEVKIELIKAAIEVSKKHILSRIDQLKIGSKSSNENNPLSAYKNSFYWAAQVHANINFDALKTSELMLKNYNIMNKWSHNIFTDDFMEKKKVNDYHVALDTYAIPLSRQIDPIERSNRKNLLHIIKSSRNNIFILGQPGSGKTTTIKKYLQDSIENLENEEKSFFLIRCRDISTQDSGMFPIIKEISKNLSFNLSIEVPQKIEEKYQKEINEIVDQFYVEAIAHFIDEMDSVIILDGFDEIPSTELKIRFKDEISMLSKILYKSNIIVTSRTGEVDTQLPDFLSYEISPLSEIQIEEFVGNWIKDKGKFDEFIKKLKVSTFYDTMMRPLTLSHLCAVYERTDKFPEKPRHLYERIIKILLERWDFERNVKRVDYLNSFDIDQKYKFLTNIAYDLSFEKNAYVIKSDDLSSAFRLYGHKFGLDRNLKNFIIKDIESTTGLFVQSGYDTFEFSHKSIQEFLAADYLMRSGRLINKRHDLNQVLSELSISVSLSSEPTQYLADIIRHRIINRNFSREFYFSILNRIDLEYPDFSRDRFTTILLLIILSRWIAGEDADKYNSALKFEIGPRFINFHSNTTSISPFLNLIKRHELIPHLQEILFSSTIRRYNDKMGIYSIDLPRGYINDKLIEYSVIIPRDIFLNEFDINWRQIKQIR